MMEVHPREGRAGRGRQALGHMVASLRWPYPITSPHLTFPPALLSCVADSASPRSYPLCPCLHQPNPSITALAFWALATPFSSFWTMSSPQCRRPIGGKGPTRPLSPAWTGYSKVRRHAIHSRLPLLVERIHHQRSTEVASVHRPLPPFLLPSR